MTCMVTAAIQAQHYPFEFPQQGDNGASMSAWKVMTTSNPNDSGFMLGKERVLSDSVGGIEGLFHIDEERGTTSIQFSQLFGAQWSDV